MFLNNSAIFGTTLLAHLGYLRKMSASTRNPGVETLSIDTPLHPNTGTACHSRGPKPTFDDNDGLATDEAVEFSEL